MLWSTKHIYLDKGVEQNLLKLSGTNILIHGPHGNSQHVYAERLTKHVTGIPRFEDWVWSTVELNDDKKSELSLFTRKSRLHTDIVLNEHVCNNKSIIKYFIKSHVKNRCLSVDGTLIHKTIVIYNIEYLNTQNQHELKNIIEKYWLNNTIIMLSNRIDSITDNIKNMMIVCRIGLPTSVQLVKFVKKTLIDENTTINTRIINQHINSNHQNPVNVLNSLQMHVNKITNTNEQMLQKLCDHIRSSNLKQIRELLYILLVQNICPIHIIKHITHALGTYDIVMYAAKYSHMITQSERVIYHLEAFTNYCVLCLESSIQSSK